MANSSLLDKPYEWWIGRFVKVGKLYVWILPRKRQGKAHYKLNVW